jgi:hypothetical protein
MKRTSGKPEVIEIESSSSASSEELVTESLSVDEEESSSQESEVEIKEPLSEKEAFSEFSLVWFYNTAVPKFLEDKKLFIELGRQGDDISASLIINSQSLIRKCRDFYHDLNRCKHTICNLKFHQSVEMNFGRILTHSIFLSLVTYQMYRLLDAHILGFLFKEMRVTISFLSPLVTRLDFEKYWSIYEHEGSNYIRVLLLKWYHEVVFLFDKNSENSLELHARMWILF